MVFDLANEDYKDIYQKQKEKNDKTFIVQFGNETYEPISLLNKEIENTYSIREIMENVGKHKVPDCIIAKNIFTLIVFDKDGNTSKSNIIRSISFLKLMCEKYEVRNLIVINTSFGKIFSRRQLKELYVKYFTKTPINVYFANKKGKE